ncbi:MAG TPA: hypothetical protein VGP62_02380 [Bryobacteraceae bacterium]|jgi:hypothetical protein|nr:hypothetical protein [Bryobacteraceae bacterium]
MIQLNTTSLSASQDPSSSLMPTPQSQTGDGFQTALSAALSATLQQFGINPASVNLSITPAGATSTPAAVTPFSAAAKAPPVASTTPTETSTAPAPQESFDDAYWAAQPSAVQALRNIDDYDRRSELASKLAGEGYNIDVPIMVYGWDPAKITAARESYGYTWVPSALQNPVAEAPGISLGGTTPYNPNNPPAGSIAV